MKQSIHILVSKLGILLLLGIASQSFVSIDSTDGIAPPQELLWPVDEHPQDVNGCFLDTQLKSTPTQAKESDTPKKRFAVPQQVIDVCSQPQDARFDPNAPAVEGETPSWVSNTQAMLDAFMAHEKAQDESSRSLPCRGDSIRCADGREVSQPIAAPQSASFSELKAQAKMSAPHLSEIPPFSNAPNRNEQHRGTRPASIAAPTRQGVHKHSSEDAMVNRWAIRIPPSACDSCKMSPPLPTKLNTAAAISADDEAQGASAFAALKPSIKRIASRNPDRAFAPSNTMARKVRRFDKTLATAGQSHKQDTSPKAPPQVPAQPKIAQADEPQPTQPTMQPKPEPSITRAAALPEEPRAPSTTDLAPAANGEDLTRQLTPQPATAQPAERQQAQLPDENVSQHPTVAKGRVGRQEGFLINFPNVSMTEYIRFVSRLTNRNFIFNDEDLQFNVTIVSEEPTTLDNIMAALLQELRIHGLYLIEQGNNLLIHKSAANSPAELLSDEERSKGAPESELVTRVFRLNNVGPEKIAAVVRQMLSGQALVQVLSDTNTLIITDLSTNVTKIAQLIRALDLPTTTYEVGQYVGLNNFIENIVPMAEQILTPIAGGQTLLFVPHLATNSVFIVSSTALVRRAIAVLERLDYLEGETQILTLDDLRLEAETLVSPSAKEKQKGRLPNVMREGEGQEGEETLIRRPLDLSPENLAKQRQKLSGPSAAQEAAAAAAREEEEINQTKFYIHKLQYRQGDQLTSALTSIAESLRLNEKANVDLINAINSAQWIQSSNSIVVTGTADALGRVRELILELDVALKQILLEMLILDTTVADSLKYSVDWGTRFSGLDSAGAQGFTNDVNSPTLNTSLNAVTAASGLINPNGLVGSSGFSLGVIGRRILKSGNFFSDMGALVQAVDSVDDDRIVLNPKIVVEDNFSAEIFVGQNTAFLTQVVVNDLGSVIANNVEFRDVGTTMKVTPQLGADNIITLVIEQEVSSVITTSSGTSSGGGGTGTTAVNPGPSTNKSTTTTKIHVPDKFFVILSGMIRDDTKVSRVQVPCLGVLPVIGGLFASEKTTTDKRNILIFIRPQIVDAENFNEVTRHQQEIWKEKNYRKPRWKYEAEKAMDYLNLPHCEEDGGCSTCD